MQDQWIKLDEINLHSLLRDLLRDWWIPIALAISIWLAAGTYGMLSYEPTYTSEATFVVSAKGSSSAYSSLSLTTNMAKVFSEVFESSILREKVDEKLDMEDTDWYISTRTISQTNLLVVSVISSSPEQSFLALNAVIETYPEMAQMMFGNAILEVITDPKVPTSASNSLNVDQMKTNGAIAGFVVGIAAILALSILRDTVKTSSAARRKLDGRLISSVRHEEKNKTLRAKRKKKNIAPLINNPFVSTGFQEDYHSLCSKLEYHMRKRNQKVVLVSSAGENEGKSTVSSNLALSLAARGKKVALVDCDFRKPALHKIFTLTPDEDHDLGRYLARDEEYENTLRYYNRHDLFIAANSAGHKYPQRLITSRRMEGFIRRLRREMDYVILDTPPMLVAADTEALAVYADVGILVVREDWAMVRSINDCLDNLNRVLPDTAGFVLNNCKEGQKLLPW